MGVLVREVAALYAAFAEGRPSPLPELPVQYADFAVWQRAWLHGEVLESEIAFWRRQLAGLPPLLELPTDRPRPAVQSFRGAARPVRLPAELTRQAQALGRREGATLFMVLLAGFQALLARYSGQDDLAVGTPVAGRNRVEIEGLIGFFVNTLVLRGDLTGEPTFRELLGRVRETALAAYAHQDVPFEKLVEELAPERSLAHTPLFQVMLVLQNAPVESLEIRDLRLRPVGGAGTTAKFDLTLSLEERDGGLAGTVEYATDLFDAATIDRLIRHFERLLAAAVAAPERPALGAAAARRGRAPPAPGASGTTRAVAGAARTAAPRAVRGAGRADARSAVAVVCGERALTYGELDRAGQPPGPPPARPRRRPGRAGRRLRSSARSSWWSACSAILKAGGAYVPLDPGYPRGAAGLHARRRRRPGRC